MRVSILLLAASTTIITPIFAVPVSTASGISDTPTRKSAPLTRRDPTRDRSYSWDPSYSRSYGSNGFDSEPAAQSNPQPHNQNTGNYAGNSAAQQTWEERLQKDVKEPEYWQVTIQVAINTLGGCKASRSAGLQDQQLSRCAGEKLIQAKYKALLSKLDKAAKATDPTWQEKIINDDGNVDENVLIDFFVEGYFDKLTYVPRNGQGVLDSQTRSDLENTVTDLAKVLSDYVYDEADMKSLKDPWRSP
ncbi:hypothetical protein FRB99_005652 [Tulasnella sp. 403]|nr:hypothetical protein FRB99_005652 [Tulasnella sp. 403]